MGFSSGVRNFCLSIILGWSADRLRGIFLVFQMKYTLQVIMQPAVYSSWNTNIEKAFNIELLVWWKPPTLFRWKKRNSYFYYQRKVTHCFERFYYSYVSASSLFIVCCKFWQFWLILDLITISWFLILHIKWMNDQQKKKERENIVQWKTIFFFTVETFVRGLANNSLLLRIIC